MKTITIAGGGLAGLTLGIGLRQRGIPVRIFEAGRYPRHRVCGEFISGSGQSVLNRLGLEQKLFASGACLAKTTHFYSQTRQLFGGSLPAPAICISRHVLDSLLARYFRELGGELHEQRRWSDPFIPGMVNSTGRRNQGTVAGWRWYGLKAHARQVQMESDLEMHLHSNSYVGLCRLPGGEVNVCGLFRSRIPVPDIAKTWQQRLEGVPGSPLANKLEKADFVSGSFCAVAALYLPPQKALGRQECCIGDALTMIAPVTGNGMSMAFESAGVAISPLERFSRGQSSWDEAREEIAICCDETFRDRLRWGNVIQKSLFTRPLRTALLWFATQCPAIWPVLFRKTRQ